MSKPGPEGSAVAPAPGRSTSAAYAPWVRALLDTGLPRALRRHDTPEGIAYRRYLNGLLDRFGVTRPLPKGLLSPLREAGIATLELQRLQADLEGLRERRGGGVRRQEERRLRGEIRKTRVQVAWLERRVKAAVKELAAQNGHGDPLDALARDANRQERS